MPEPSDRDRHDRDRHDRDRHDDDRHDDDGADDDLGRLVRIERELRALGRDLDALREALGREVRTRRVVVVEDDGFERVVVSARGAFGFVAVRARADDRGTTGVELFANDPIDGDGPHLGVALSDRGDVVATLDRLDGHEVRLWLGDPT